MLSNSDQTHPSSWLTPFIRLNVRTKPSPLLIPRILVTFRGHQLANRPERNGLPGAGTATRNSPTRPAPTVGGKVFGSGMFRDGGNLPWHIMTLSSLSRAYSIWMRYCMRIFKWLRVVEKASLNVFELQHPLWIWKTDPNPTLEHPWYPKSNYLVLISTHRKVFPKASIAGMSKSRYPHLCAGELQQAQFIQHGQQIHQVANFDVTSVEAQWMFWCQRYDVPQLSTWIIWKNHSPVMRYIWLNDNNSLPWK